MRTFRPTGLGQQGRHVEWVYTRTLRKPFNPHHISLPNPITKSVVKDTGFHFDSILTISGHDECPFLLLLNFKTNVKFCYN